MLSLVAAGLAGAAFLALFDVLKDIRQSLSKVETLLEAKKAKAKKRK